MDNKIIKHLKKEIESLANKKLDLQKSIEELEKYLAIDDIQIEKLKKEKLQIKDKISTKENELKSSLNKILLELFAIKN